MKKTKKIKIKKEEKVPEFKLNNQKYYHKDPRNKLEEYVIGLLPKITKAYGLEEINYYFQTVDEVMVSKMKDGSGNEIMSITYAKEYKSAYINLMPEAMNLFNHGEVEIIFTSIIHEVGHIMTDRLGKLALSRFVTKDDVRNAVEETTEAISMIVRGVLLRDGVSIIKGK